MNMTKVSESIDGSGEATALAPSGVNGPKYQQLQDYMRERIIAGAWQPGMAIPSENALVQQFGVARMTVRQAIDGLIREGLLVRQRGRGTFVMRPRVERVISRLRSFSEDMRERGLEPSSRLLERSVVPAPPEVSERLRLHVREAVIYLRRLRLADGVPMALETTYLSYDLGRDIFDADLESGSLYTFLQEKAGVQLSYSAQELEAALPDRDEARLLDLPARRPVLVFRYTTYIHGPIEDIPAIYGTTVYRGDRYRFRLEVPR